MDLAAKAKATMLGALFLIVNMNCNLLFKKIYMRVFLFLFIKNRKRILCFSKRKRTTITTIRNICKQSKIESWKKKTNIKRTFKTNIIIINFKYLFLNKFCENLLKL
jgi:hypothetical protein